MESMLSRFSRRGGSSSPNRATFSPLGAGKYMRPAAGVLDHLRRAYTADQSVLFRIPCGSTQMVAGFVSRTYYSG